MTLCELSVVMDAPISIHYRTQTAVTCKERWYAEIDGAEIKEETILASVFGNGNSPNEAMMELVQKLRGKLVVVDASSKERRRTIQVPMSLVLDSMVVR